MFVLTYSVVDVCNFIYFFFFKQKTAYDMRISDWSSDVCSFVLVCFVGLDLKPHREIGQVKVGKIPFARKVESFLLVRPIPSNSFEENSPPRLRPRPECYSLEEAWQGFDRRCHISVLSCFAADPGMIFCISRRSASVSGSPSGCHSRDRKSTRLNSRH